MSTAQEIGTNGNSIEQTPAWKLEGLPGQPIVESSPGKMHFVQLDTLIRDERGKIITAPRRGNIEKLMSEHLGKTIEAVKTYPEKGWSHPNEFEDVVTFRYEGCGRLSLLERRAIAAFAWMADSYHPPMKRRDRIVFPTALSDLPKELQSPRLKTQMWRAFTEDKAIQVAGVLESMWPDISTTVFEDGDGWFVAVDAGEREIEDVSTMERIETVLWMLTDFDAVPNESSLNNLEASMCEDEMIAAREHLDAKAVRAFNAYATQQRLETKLDELLAHLAHPVTNAAAAAPKGGHSVETPSDRQAVDVFAEPPAGDKHTLPPKPGKKSAPKKTA